MPGEKSVSLSLIFLLVHANMSVKRLGDQAPPWPWKDGPHRDDMIGGISLVYRQWRVDNNLPVDTNEGATN